MKKELMKEAIREIRGCIERCCIYATTFTPGVSDHKKADADLKHGQELFFKTWILPQLDIIEVELNQQKNV